jgi:hypothetical protein
MIYSVISEGVKGRTMQLSEIQTSEVAILSRVLKPDQPSLSTAAAKAILALEFDAVDKDRMHELSAKAQEGTLTHREQAELNNLERVGHMIGLMQSKARHSIKARQATNGKGKAH